MDVKDLSSLSSAELEKMLNEQSNSKLLQDMMDGKEIEVPTTTKGKGKNKYDFSDKKSLSHYAKIAGMAKVKSSVKKKLLEDYGFNDEDLTEDAFLIVSLLQSAEGGNIQALNAYRDITRDEMLESVETQVFSLPAKLLPSNYVDINREIDEGLYKEVFFQGGRGSCKSTYISEKLIEMLKNDNQMHIIVFRQVKDTLKNSVFSQIIWSIDKLGLTMEFKITKNPLEITYKPTGQKIYFLGADEKGKVKGIKPSFGYFGAIWFEEVDQFNSAEDLRSITQSAIRGVDKAVRFYSMNPPKSSRAWVNKFILQNENVKYGFKVHRSDYRTVPKKWLGEDFFLEAEQQKLLNEKAYNHEYLGEITGAGDNVFDNIVNKPISDREILSFSNSYYGADFGFKDATAWNAMYYDSDRKILYIYDEFHKTHLTDPSELMMYLDSHGYDKNLLITADSHDADKIAFMQNYGFNVTGVKKVKAIKYFGYNFLVGLNQIVIDAERCPYTYKEFYEYHHNLNKNDELINDYPEGQEDHHMSSVIYALEILWKRQNAWRGINKFEDYIENLPN